MAENKKRTLKKDGHQLTILVTQELFDQLESLRQHKGAKAAISDVVRDALRAHIDAQENVIGSRAQFNRTLRKRIDQSDELFKKEMEALSTKLANLLLLKIDSSSNALNDQMLTLILSELHTILYMQAKSFAAILTRMMPSQEAITADGLIDNAIPHAHNNSAIYTAKHEIAMAEIPVIKADPTAIKTGKQ
jgi:hypothetical protein